MLRYAITDRKSYAGNHVQQLDSLVRQAAQWAFLGIDFIQVREKDLPAGELANLTRQMLATLADSKGKSRILVSSRADIAVATGAHGVHLTSASGELTPAQVRQVFQTAGRPQPLLSISCHTLEEIQRADQAGVDAILFGPVFGKSHEGVEVVPAAGLQQLQAACTAAGKTNVFALGGVTPDLADLCLQAGAAGIAAIRLFQNLPHE